MKTTEPMTWPDLEEWKALVPIERFEIAARLVVEARQRRNPDATTLSPNEGAALTLLSMALRSLGYEPACQPLSSPSEWRRV